MGSPFLHFAQRCSHLPENSILFENRPFSARFSNCSNSLNFEAKINFNTTRQNGLKWRETCTGLKFDLMHFNGPQTKFIRDSLYKHPVYMPKFFYHLLAICLKIIGQHGPFENALVNKEHNNSAVKRFSTVTINSFEILDLRIIYDPELFYSFQQQTIFFHIMTRHTNIC